MNLYEFCQAELNYNTEAIAADQRLATHIQEILIWLGFLDPPADGHFGPIATQALQEFQEIMASTIPEVAQEQGILGYLTAKLLIETSPDDLPKIPLILEDNLASRIIEYMESKSYQIATKPKQYNIIYIEGMNEDGSLNDNRPNTFNDLRLVIECQEGKPVIVGKWEATTEPGYFYTYNLANEKGATRIALGQYKAWKIGTFGISEPHEALLQSANIKINRDFNKDMQRTGDQIEIGLFDIHQHWGYDFPANNIGMASAGALVGRTRQGHREFINLIKTDERYHKNSNYLFLTTVISGAELEGKYPKTEAERLEVTKKEIAPQVNGLSNGITPQSQTFIETPDYPLEIIPHMSPDQQEDLLNKIFDLINQSKLK